MNTIRMPLLLLFTLIAQSSLPGQQFTTLRKSVLPDLPFESRAAVPLDVDGDGDQDLLVGAGNLYLLHNDGTGLFGPPIDLGIDRVRFLAVVDLGIDFGTPVVVGRDGQNLLLTFNDIVGLVQNPLPPQGWVGCPNAGHISRTGVFQ